jgi:hypothetical protein
VRTLSTMVIRSSTALVTESRAHQSTNNVGRRTAVCKMKRRFCMYTLSVIIGSFADTPFWKSNWNTSKIFRETSCFDSGISDIR